MVRLSALSPFGPIFEKELRISARRKRTYFLRVFYLAALLLALLLAYTSVHESYYGSGVAARMQEQASLGLIFFFGFAYFCLVAMCAICPILTCTAISSERLAKTLPVLLMTPISGWQIIAGKLFSRLLIALTLIGLSLPVLALVRLLGGVELGQMIGVVCLCTATALSTASLGLFLSTFLNRSYVVILLAYGLILLGYMFVPMIVLMLMQAGASGPPRSFDLVAMISPFLSMMLMSEPMFSRMGATGIWVSASLVQVGWAAVLLLCSALVLRRLMRRSGEPAAVATPLPLPIPQDLASGQQASAARAAPGRRREVSDNPIAWREVRRPLMTKRWQRIVGVTVVLGAMVAIYISLALNRALGEWESQIGFAIVLNGLIWLLVSVLSATAIAQEKESDTWTLLTVTPLSGWAIVWGKVLGLLRRMVWPMVLVAAHFLLFALGPLHLISALLVLWVMVTFNTVWVAIGMYLSLRFGRPTFAVIGTLLVAVVLYLGVLAVLGILENLTGDRHMTDVVGWYAPYPYLGEAIEGYQRGVFDMPGGRISESEFLRAVFIAGILHVAVAGAILAATARSFDRIIHRAPQRRGPVFSAAAAT